MRVFFVYVDWTLETHLIKRSKSKLSDETVRALRKSTGSNQAVAVEFGLSEMTISRIRRRLRYEWIL